MRHEIRRAHEGLAHLPHRIGDPGILGNAVINSVGRPMPILKLAVGELQTQVPSVVPSCPSSTTMVPLFVTTGLRVSSCMS
jgi:hypothetical protein